MTFPRQLFRIFLFAFAQHVVYRVVVVVLGWQLASFANPPRQIATGVCVDVFVSLFFALAAVLLVTSWRRAGAWLVAALSSLLTLFLVSNAVSIFYRGENIAPGDFTYVKEIPGMADSFLLVVKGSAGAALGLLGALAVLGIGAWMAFRLAAAVRFERSERRHWMILAGALFVLVAARSSSLSWRMVQHNPAESHPFTFLHWRYTAEASYRIEEPVAGLALLRSFHERQGYSPAAGPGVLLTRRSFGVPEPGSVFLQTGTHHLPADTNVVVILAESLGRSLLIDNPAVSPMAMAQRGKSVWLENHFTNSFRTCGAKFSMLCSLDSPLGFYVQREYPRLGLRCLPKLFQERGFRTKFVTGTEAKFDNKAEWMQHNGMEHLFTGENFPPSAKRFSYGVHDEHLVERILTELDEPGAPQFMVVVTATNHHPYVVPKDFLDENPAIASWPAMEQATYYTDAMLGRLFSEARRRPWFRNTLFVVAGDHNPWGTTAGDPNTTASLSELRRRYHTVAFLAHPELRPQIVERDTSHLELAPTVLALLGWNEVVSNLQYSSVFDARFPGLIPAQENSRGSAWSLFDREKAVIRVGAGDDCRELRADGTATGPIPCEEASRRAADDYRSTFLDTLQFGVLSVLRAGGR